MKQLAAPLPVGRDLKSRQHYVQRFTLAYACACLGFCVYISPWDLELPLVLAIHFLLFLIGAPFWFRRTRIPALTLNVVSQLSNFLAFTWIGAYLGPTSHVGLNAIPQFILVLMMFGGLNPGWSWTLGMLCVVELLLPVFPFIDTWYAHLRLPEEELFVIRRVFDMTVLFLSVFQFRMIVGAWREATQRLEAEKQNLIAVSEWRYRLLRILGHDVKDPATLALQLVRRIRKVAGESVDEELLEQVEKSQLLVRDIIASVEGYALSDTTLETARESCSASEMADKLRPWLETRLDEKSLRLDLSQVNPEHRLSVAPEAFAFQVLLNILSNAVKFSPQGGVIRLLTEKQADRTRWIVRDEGRGLDQNALIEGLTQEGKGLRIATTFARLQNVEIRWVNRRAQGHAEIGTEVVLEQAASRLGVSST
jgi:signal transduction histidine kinase